MTTNSSGGWIIHGGNAIGMRSEFSPRSRQISFGTSRLMIVDNVFATFVASDFRRLVHRRRRRRRLCRHRGICARKCTHKLGKQTQ